MFLLLPLFLHLCFSISGLSCSDFYRVRGWELLSHRIVIRILIIIIIIIIIMIITKVGFVLCLFEEKVRILSFSIFRQNSEFVFYLLCAIFIIFFYYLLLFLFFFLLFLIV